MILFELELFNIVSSQRNYVTLYYFIASILVIIEDFNNY